VVLYADKVTDAMQALMDTTAERRTAQLRYNEEHSITPRQIVKEIQESLAVLEKAGDLQERVVKEGGEELDVHEVIQEMEIEMMEAAKALEYERAALLRDQIAELRAALPVMAGKAGRGGSVKKGTAGKKGYHYPKGRR
jgi:excinuclease ABC subunit B